ncbi:MAG TPA: AsmA-like C-terminal region-containing protein, partial [Chthoniobacterales bacterium]|nr:AsmA-like C-terminal region-containing protein [Chthoniobacterales bacterium]
HLFFNRPLRNLARVKTIGRVLLWLVAGAVVLACIVLLGVNLYVQSQGVHRRIQQELSQRLDTPIRLRQISVTPWSGLKLNGITIPQTPGAVGGDFLQAETFQLRVKFWSLFSDRLVIRQVLLIKPRVVWAQNSAGKWRLPELPPAPPPPPARPATTPRLTTATPPSPAPPVAAKSTVMPNEKPAAVAEVTPSMPEVRRVNLRDGDFTFLDSAGRIVAKFTGIDFTSSFRTATAIKGSTQIEKISLRDHFFIEHLDSPLHYDPAELVFSNISADAADGKLNGRFEMQLQEPGSPFRAMVKFRDLQASKLMANAGGSPDVLSGRLEGFLEATGETADANALSGRGEIFLRDGKLQQYSLLVALGQILQIEDLMRLQLDQAEVHFHISPGIVTIDQLILRSPNIRLSATGTVNFNGKLHLAAQLALNDKVRRQLFQPIRENFHPLADSPGYSAVAFHVNGTADRPKTDLMDKVVGHDLRDLGGVISSLFGGHHKKKKPRPAGSPPAPTPNDAAPASSPNESTPAANFTPAPTP